MSIYYMTKPGDVFLIQAQAIDLCIRITSCPILSLPPPKFLLDYFHAKYGSTAANDNPNTMIEEGITNDPRPRRPPMLVNQNSSFISRRNSDFMFDGPMYHGRDSFSTHSPYVLREPGDERCMRYPDEDHGLASTSSSSDTAAEKSPRLNPKSSQPSLLQKETLVPALASGGTSESSVTSLAVSWPCNPSGMDKGKVSLSFAEGESLTLSLDNPGYVALTPPPPAKRNMEEETAWAARRISRRLTMEGRRDGPDFMNLSSLVRWPHRSVVAPPSTTHPSKSGSLFPSNLFISSHHGSQYESPALQLSSSLPSTLEHGGPLIRETLISTTPRQDESGGITDNPIPAIGKRSSEDNNYHEDGHSYRGFSRIRTRGKGGPLRDDTQLEESHDSEEAPLNAYENHQSPAGGASSGHILDTESATITAATKETAAMAPDQTNPSRRGSLSKQLSMDSIRKMSRGALTRLQEGGLGAALSIPASTGPLSPTLLRTNGSPLDAKSPTKPLALSSISKPAFLPLHPIESTESPGQGSNVAEGRNDLNKN
ncbi:hypothetical protein BGW38_007371 [Lunasporangiospora selenospora]|uniref:Uncharacterized protein n=1 Tax=Lunasporangiospora selenospora TaxID=979761 RepID=A0A9P6FL54_9FUNG|nr:hypothetical protein BGW38_007371 [Lunasporangiospora selenospora]